MNFRVPGLQRIVNRVLETDSAIPAALSILAPQIGQRDVVVAAEPFNALPL